MGNTVQLSIKAGVQHHQRRCFVETPSWPSRTATWTSNSSAVLHSSSHMLGNHAWDSILVPGMILTPPPERPAVRTFCSQRYMRTAHKMGPYKEPEIWWMTRFRGHNDVTWRVKYSACSIQNILTLTHRITRATASKTVPLVKSFHWFPNHSGHLWAFLKGLWISLTTQWWPTIQAQKVKTSSSATPGTAGDITPPISVLA